MLTADPMDLEAQRLIAQEIENKNIEQNMELAMEYNPESFGTVVMLYIDCKVNGHNIKAFVDSGAQATIMSQVSHLNILVTDFIYLSHFPELTFPNAHNSNYCRKQLNGVI